MCLQCVAGGLPRNFAEEGIGVRGTVSVKYVREVAIGGGVLGIVVCVEINPKHKYCGGLLHSLHPRRDNRAERLCPCSNICQVRPYPVVYLWQTRQGFYVPSQGVKKVSL